MAVLERPFSSRTKMSRSQNSMPRDETTAKRRRLEHKKAAGDQATAMQGKAENLIDLTMEEDKQEDWDQLKHGAMDPMKVPVHLESDDYFTILSLSRTASESDVKRAYRKLAVQWHPDKNRLNPRAEEVFKRISEAYEVLSDSAKRKHYEKYDPAGVARDATRTTEHFGCNGRAAGGFSAQRARDIFATFFGGDDPFEAFLGGGQQRRRLRRFGTDPFGSMGFGGIGMGMTMPGFGRMGGMSTMNHFVNDGLEGMAESSARVYSTSTSSSSSTFTDRNGDVIHQKSTTSTGSDGRTETVTEEYRNGKLVNSSSSSSATFSRLAGTMQLDGSSSVSKRSYRRHQLNNSCPDY